METRERILWEALGLFARKGFEAVSVRELAGAVGIRESSLYNHFKSKQDIFDCLVDTCWGKAQEYFQQQGLPFSAGDDLSAFSERDFGRLGEAVSGVFRYFFEDPWARLFRQVLVVSQYHDCKAMELYNKLYRDYPLHMQEAIFRGLMESGGCPPGDPAAMALGFYGGVFLLLHTCGSWEEARPLFMQHLAQFTRQMDISCEREDEK